MNTTTNFVRLLGAIRDHLAVADPPGEIAQVQVSIDYLDGERVTVHLCGLGLPELAAALLGWADGLTAVSVRVWRVPEGGRVHLTVSGRLVDETVEIYGGVPYEPTIFGPDLTPGDQQRVTLGMLRGWAPGRAA